MMQTMQVLSGKKVVETEKNTYEQTTRQLLTQQNNDSKVSYTYDGFLRPTSMTTFGRTYEQRLMKPPTRSCIQMELQQLTPTMS